MKPPYQPVYELTRADTIESVHFGAVAVVDIAGNLLAWFADPQAVAFLRSTAKPFQALPFIQADGKDAFQLSQEEIAIMCASHSGTDQHVTVVQGLQRKTGVSETQLLCGVHPPTHTPTAEALRERNEQPTPNRHNCSGKHTGMLAFSAIKRAAGITSPLDYIDPQHPVQRDILSTFAEMCGLAPDQVALGIDGCSAPNFAVPLYNTALAFARLCDPETGGVNPPERARACRTIVKAITDYPEMVAGPERFDTRLMEVAGGRIISKGGAEGYHGIGLLPGAMRQGSPALGIALKISDGDARGKASAAVTLEVLRQLGALTEDELEGLANFGPQITLRNFRNLLVGQGRPVFQLSWAKP